MHYAVLGLGVVLLAIALFALAGLVALADGSLFLRWQALIGALLGASGTIFVGWLTHAAVQHSERRDAKKRTGEQTAAKTSAVLAITESVRAAAVALAALRRALGASGEARS